MPFFHTSEELGLCRFVFKEGGWVDVLSPSFRGYQLSLHDPSLSPSVYEGGSVFLGEPPSNCPEATVGLLGVECTTDRTLSPRFRIPFSSPSLLPREGWSYAATILLSKEGPTANVTLPCSLSVDEEQFAYISLFAMFSLLLATIPCFFYLLFLVPRRGKTMGLIWRRALLEEGGGRKKDTARRPFLRPKRRRTDLLPNSIPSRSVDRPTQRTASLSERRLPVRQTRRSSSLRR